MHLKFCFYSQFTSNPQYGMFHLHKLEGTHCKWYFYPMEPSEFKRKKSKERVIARERQYANKSSWN